MSAAFLSDDEYDVISNPGHDGLLEDSLAVTVPRELPALEDAQDRFETTRWTAEEIQSFVRKQIASAQPLDNNKKVRVYVDGTFDTFGVGHALQLRQAKLAFPFVHLMVGVFSDDVLLQNNSIPAWPEVERLELVRHCRWVDEVVRDAPWELSTTFLNSKHIDFVAIDEGTSVDPTCCKARVKGYDELKKHGKIIKTRRTNGLLSQRRAFVSLSQPATPTLRSASEASDVTERGDM